MKSFFKENSRILILYFFWIFCGIIVAPLAYLIIPVSILIFRKNEMYKEIFFGFFLILILSDSRQEIFLFAKKIKDFYMILLAIIMLVDRQKFQPFNKFFISFIPFFLVAAMAIYNSEVKLLSLQKMTSYFLLILTVPNYISMLYLKEGNRVLKFFVYNSFLVLISGFVLRFLAPEITFMAGRYTGILGNPNGLGVFSLLFCILVFVVNSFFPDLFSRKEKNILIITAMVSLLFSGARSSIIAILIFFILIRTFKWSFLIGIASFLLIILVYQLVSDNIASIIISLGLENYFRLETLKEGSGRLVAWAFAWNNIQKNFFIGKGFGYAEWLFVYFIKELSNLGHSGTAHNSYLTFWLETGLVGLIFYFFAFIGKFIISLKNTAYSFPILCAILFSNFFESWITASLNPFTIQVFIILTIITDPIFLKNIDSNKNDTNSLE